jgi:hypothetical protein
MNKKQKAIEDARKLARITHEFKKIMKKVAELTIDRDITCYCGKRVFTTQASDDEVAYISSMRITTNQTIKVTAYDENGFTLIYEFYSAEAFFTSELYMQ